MIPSPLLNEPIVTLIRLKTEQLGHDLTNEQVRAVITALLWMQQRLMERGK